MRCLPKSDRTPKWTLHIFLTLVGVLMLLSDPVQSQQKGQEPTPTGKCPLPDQELGPLINMLNNIEQQPELTKLEANYAEESDEESDAESRLAARCARELKKLREAIIVLHLGYYDFKRDTSPLNSTWYRFWHGRYVEHKQFFTTQLENVVKQIRSQDQLQSKKLRDKFDAVEKQMNETLSKIGRI